MLLWFFVGAMASYGFAPNYLWPLTVISIAVAYLYVNRPRDGFAWGAGYGIFSITWTLSSIFTYDGYTDKYEWFYPIGLLLIGGFYGIIWACPFYLSRKAMAKSRGELPGVMDRPLYFAAACAVIAWIWERHVFHGWPWNPIANLWINTDVALLMRYIGAIGLTFITIGMIASVAELIKTLYSNYNSKCRMLNFKFLIFFAPLLFVPLIPRIDTMTDFRVRIVQPAFPMTEKMETATMAKIIENEIIKMAQLPGLDNIDMLIFPETAWPWNLSGWNTKLPAFGVPLVTGANVEENGLLYNALLYTDKDGNIIDMFFKFRLTPFSEYRPFGGLIPTPGTYAKGPGPRIINNWVPMICYEMFLSDSSIPRDSKPDFIINITNDSWFGTTSGIFQMVDMARRQAIESGLPLVRANYGGISSIIDADGRELQRTELGMRTIMDGQIPAAYNGITFYRRIGLEWMLIIILSVSILFVNRRRWRQDAP